MSASALHTSYFTDRPATFWALMGPFFASKAIRKEMPYLADDAGYVWFVIQQDDRVVGFASLHIDTARQIGHLHGLYVVPELRGNGVASQLLQSRLDYLRERGVRTVRVTANRQSAPLLALHGFTHVSQKGSYEVMEVRL